MSTVTCAATPVRSATDFETPLPASAAQSMDLIFRQHRRALYGYLLRLTRGDHHYAEDLLQEVLLRAWRYLQTRKLDEATVRSWLFTVARNLVIDGARARRARPSEAPDYDLSMFAASDHPIESVSAVEIVRRGLRMLNPEHRRVLFEVFYCDLPTKEAAARLNIPEGTVKSRTHNALRKLGAAISVAYEDGAECSQVSVARTEA